MYDQQPKYGKARSDAQRRRRHKKLYGTSKLPERGTGKKYTAEAIQAKMRGK